MCMCRCVSSVKCVCTDVLAVYICILSVHRHVDRGVEKKKELTSLTNEEVLETVKHLIKEDST